MAEALEGSYDALAQSTAHRAILVDGAIRVKR